MNISSLVDLIDGDLKNPPSISFVYNIQTDVERLKNGDLFISNNETNIKKAVEKGAFGIVYQSDLINITDKEIAWIKVKDIEEVIIKISRYVLSNLELNIFYVDEVVLDIIDLCIGHGGYVYINDDISTELSKIQAIEPNQLVLSTDKILLQKIYPSYKNFPIKNYNLSNITIHSIFETTFSYNGILYSRAKIPFFYIDLFLSIVEYLKIENPINDISGFKKWNLLSPIFINKSFKQIDFGRSDKFIISTKSINRAITALSHIQKNFKYGKVHILLDKSYSKLIKNAFFYEDAEELEFFIKTLSYNLLYIVGTSSEDIISILQKTQQDPTLFDN